MHVQIHTYMHTYNTQCKKFFSIVLQSEHEHVYGCQSGYSQWGITTIYENDTALTVKIQLLNMILWTMKVN